MVLVIIFSLLSIVSFQLASPYSLGGKINKNWRDICYLGSFFLVLVSKNLVWKYMSVKPYHGISIYFFVALIFLYLFLAYSVMDNDRLERKLKNIKIFSNKIRYFCSTMVILIFLIILLIGYFGY